MFIQQITATSDKPDELADVYERWAADATTNGTATTTWLATNRDAPGHFEVIAVFPSYEEAMANSEREQTDAYSREFADLCTGDLLFRDLDVAASAGTSGS